MDYRRRKFELEKDLAHWEAKSKKKNKRFYIFYLFFLIALAYVIDEIASNINGLMQKQVIDTFFSGDFDKYVIVTTLCSAMSIFAFIYRGLADKFGRKPFLFINTIGFGLGMFVCFISNSVIFYIIGLLIIYFFGPCDIHVLYIIEIAPSKHRGLFLTLGKAIGVLGVALIPSLRDWAISINWQYIFLIPACIAVVVGILIFFFVKESDVFLKNKIISIKNDIRFVENPASEYAKLVEEKKDNVGIIEAVKYTLQNKEILWLFLVGAVISIVSIGVSYYPSILHDDQTTNALFIYPFTLAIIEVIMGIITDKMGRKTSVLISGLLAMMGFLLFIIAVNKLYNPYIIGLYLGIFLGGYFAIMDIFNIICGEISPTNIRASLLSLLSVSLSVGGFLATGILLLCSLINKNLDLGFFCLVLIVPSLFFSLLIILTKVPETKNKSELQVEKIVKLETIQASIKNNVKDEKPRKNKIK